MLVFYMRFPNVFMIFGALGDSWGRAMGNVDTPGASRWCIGTRQHNE